MGLNDGQDDSVDGGCEVCGRPGWRRFGHTVCGDHVYDITLDEAGS